MNFVMEELKSVVSVAYVLRDLGLFGALAAFIWGWYKRVIRHSGELADKDSSFAAERASYEQRIREERDRTIEAQKDAKESWDMVLRLMASNEELSVINKEAVKTTKEAVHVVTGRTP